MKYIVILADGMADWPCPELDGKTPMTVADKPHINAMAGGGLTGLCQTVPPEFAPGSDVANLSIMGYAPQEFYRGRSSLEALSAGVPMAEGDLSLRANLVQLSDEPEFLQRTMVDYSGGDIATEDARELIAAVAAELDTDLVRLFPGVSYRHILLRRGEAADTTTYTPPHDMMGEKVADRLPQGAGAEEMLEFMRRASEILARQPYNLAKAAKGEGIANALWLWGPGTKPLLPNFQQRWGKKGGVLSAVDLLRGIGIAAGMDILHLSTATGRPETDFRGKGEVAAAYLQGGADFVYVHVEAPDESGHQGLLDKKISAIERIDQETIPPILDALAAMGEDYRMLVLPDHFTPLEIRTHARDAVPFVLFDSRHHSLANPVVHDEVRAAAQGLFLPNGPCLLENLFNDNLF